MEVERKLAEMGLTLPPPVQPMGSYVLAVRTGNLLFLAGHGPVAADGSISHIGKLGREINVEQGYEAARNTGLNLLSTTKVALGDLDKVRRVVKLLSMVNCVPDFVETAPVANGCSDLLISLYGDAGKHGRSAVGMASLPVGIPVEIEMILEVAD